ncbi:MAG: RNA polymerase sigma factor [Acidimicrobiales bacterium]
MSATDSTAAVEAVFRIEFPRVLAGLTRYVGDIDLAEELAQEALLDALRQWPTEGTPRNPGAWLATVGKRKAIDLFRRNHSLSTKYAQIERDLETAATMSIDFDLDLDDAGSPDGDIEDDLLRLIFVACHPVLSLQARVALTLRLLGGLTTSEIARAYLTSEPTIAQRIVRAKKTIARAGIPFEVPGEAERSERLAAVLEVIYLIYNEGYSATAGDAWLRPDLCGEALRLGRVLAGLDPGDAEVHGLVALMEIQSSRLAARIGPSGEPILLLDQDRRKWDRLLINRGLDALTLAYDLSPVRGPYTLQAAIAACHVQAFRAEDTNWTQVAELYAELAETAPSPIVELNRAVAIARASGPEEALQLVDQLVALGALHRYHLLYSVRGDLLESLGRNTEAAVEFEQAAVLAQNGAERALLLGRAATNSELGRIAAKP